jgi:hypothetical protein
MIETMVNSIPSPNKITNTIVTALTIKLFIIKYITQL